MQHLRRLLLAVPAVILLAGLSVWAARLGVAATRAAEAEREITGWQATNTNPRLEEWLRVRDSLNASLRLAPRNGPAEEALGRLHGLRRQSRDFMELAGDHYKAALTHRPAWPYSWVNLADVRYVLGRTGGDYGVLLTQAALLGSSEAGVQVPVADYGLAVWDELGPEPRAAVIRVITFGMQRNPMEMLQIARRRGRLDLICPMALTACEKTP